MKFGHMKVILFLDAARKSLLGKGLTAEEKVDGLIMTCGLCKSTRIKLKDCGAKGVNTEVWEGEKTK